MDKQIWPLEPFRPISADLDKMKPVPSKSWQSLLLFARRKGLDQQETSDLWQEYVDEAQVELPAEAMAARKTPLGEGDWEERMGRRKASGQQGSMF